MRRHYILAACLLLSVVVAPGAKAANVLLPSGSSSSSSSSLPNLGLGAPSTSSQGASSSTSSPAPATTPEPAPSQQPAQQTTQQPAAETSMPDFGAIDQSASQRLPQESDYLKTLHQGFAPNGTSLLTQVLAEPDYSAELISAYKDAPSTLLINIDRSSVYTSDDVQTISKTLGLTAAQIPNACFLTTRGVINTNEGSFVILGSTTRGQALPGTSGPTQSIVKYSGRIQDIMLSATTFCLSSNIPAGAGLVSKSGDYYQIDLAQIPCTPPSNRSAANLNVVYQGMRASRCTWN